jgi:multidrug efflux pump subunit AcrA (membrane-fusion protein)
MMQFDRIVPVLLVACLLALAGDLICLCPITPSAAQKNEPAADVQVKVVRARQAWFAAELHVTGYLVPRDEAVVFLDRGYRISEILATEGDRVNSGQPLARLTREGPAPPAGPTGTPGGSPAAAQGPPAPPATKDLKAPAAGVIIRSTAAVGAVASPPGMPADPLFRIAIDNEIELEAEVGVVYAPQLTVGQAARVEIENLYSLSGNVRLTPAAVDPKFQVSHARVTLEQDPRLRIGMFVRATIEANRSRGISVPRSALFYRTEGPSVQVVRQNTVETRLVRVGLHSDTDTEIVEGLQEGDLVVAYAGSSLRDGSKVKPVESDATRTELR